MKFVILFSTKMRVSYSVRVVTFLAVHFLLGCRTKKKGRERRKGIGRGRQRERGIERGRS